MQLSTTTMATRSRPSSRTIALAFNLEVAPVALWLSMLPLTRTGNRSGVTSTTAAPACSPATAVEHGNERDRTHERMRPDAFMEVPRVSRIRHSPIARLARTRIGPGPKARVQGVRIAGAPDQPEPRLPPWGGPSPPE